MNILILGGTGAMGEPLVKILNDNKNKIYVTSRKKHESKNNIIYLEGNAQNEEFLNAILKEKFDVIIDFMVYDYEKFKIRVDKLLSNTNQYIFLSSSRVYANSEEKITENSIRLLDSVNDKSYLETDEYALSKARQENILFNSKQKNWTIIRPYITFESERLQLGFYEKEEWLYRVLNNKTIPMPTEVLDKVTAFTNGNDVAKGIAQLVGNNNAFGQAFNITTNENKTWRQILNIYENKIYENFNIKMKIKEINDINKFMKIWGESYQIKYDRMYNRVFDNSKFENVCKDKVEFKTLEKGLEESIKNFKINGLRFRYISTKNQAIMDKMVKEKTKVKTLKEKIKYIIYRYTIYK